MNLDQSPAHWEAADRGNARAARFASILTIALPADLQQNLPPHIANPNARVRNIAMAELSSVPLTGSAAPKLVLSPLIAPGFDAIDLLTILREAAYAGRYLVLSPPMPDIPLIRSDILAMAGRLDVDVIAVDGGSNLHEV